MFTTIASIALLVAGGLAVKEFGQEGWKNISGNEDNLKNSISNFYNNLNNSPLKNISVYDVVGKMYLENQLDEKEYNQAIKLLQRTEDAYSVTGDNIFAKGWDFVTDQFKKMSINNKDTKELTKLYEKMTAYDKTVAGYTNDALRLSGDDIRNLFTSGVPEIKDAPAPQYFDTDIDPYQIDVEPAKIWTNQELADHHNINYDLNNYYDLIKQGTEANVDLGKYQSNQIANAALQNNTEANVSYLDSIRQNKANAMAEGATLGARAAQDLLANMNSVNAFAENQNTAAQERYNAVDAYLQADAQAKLQANKYFTNLASSLWNDSASLYYSDTDMSSQGYKTNADLHAADRNLAAQNAYLNGQMAGNYAAAQSAINASRTQANAQLDEYAWLFERMYNANNYDLGTTIRDMNNYIFHGYTGYEKPFDFLLDNAK